MLYCMMNCFINLNSVEMQSVTIVGNAECLTAICFIHGSKDMHDLVLIFLFMLQSVISLLTHGTSNTDCDVTSYAYMLS